MPQYRVFDVKEDAHLAGPSRNIECPVDQMAIEQAKQMKDGKIIEVWEGGRRIAEIK
jgi:hypothetical protein